MKRVKLIPPSARVICYHCWEYNRFTFTIYRDADKWILETTGEFDLDFRNWKGTLAEITEEIDAIVPDWRELEFWDKKQLCNRTCGDAIREEVTTA